MSNTVQYPWRTRLGWRCKGHMFFVDVCESECLDTARALWLTGAEYVILYDRSSPDKRAWKYMSDTQREWSKGGYSCK